MGETRRTVSIIEAAAETGVSRRTIYNWLGAGKLQFKRTAGGSIRIYADSLWREEPTGSSVDVAPLSEGG